METQVDLQFFAAVAAITTALIGGAKKAFPAWVSGKEELLALAIPVVLVVLAKAAGGMIGATSWVNAMLLATGAGVGSGLFHDYIVAPVMQNKVAK